MKERRTIAALKPAGRILLEAGEAFGCGAVLRRFPDLQKDKTPAGAPAKF